MQKTTTYLLLTLTGLLVLSAHSHAEPTYAERLGWPEGSKVVIFHSDDAGMCHSANVGTLESMKEGVVTSTSTMMPCGWVPEWARILKENPDLDNGLHLTFTSEWEKYRWGPLAGRDVVPGLIDEEGCMWGDVEEVVANATAAEIEKEMLAQIDRAEKMGMPITHIDSHMGTLFASQEFFMTYIKVAVQKQIPMLIAGGHLTHILESEAEAAEQLLGFGIPEAVWNAGLPVIDDIHTSGYDWDDPKQKKEGVIKFLRELKPGITEFIVHCTRPNDEFEFISSSGPTRLADLEVMTDPDVKKVIEEEGIVLTTWRELKERRDAVKAAEEAEAVSADK
jgi:predicted glycoside hydrolase/deacetylase ChbG (UPF0249 family)